MHATDVSCETEKEATPPKRTEEKEETSTQKVKEATTEDQPPVEKGESTSATSGDNHDGGGKNEENKPSEKSSEEPPPIREYSFPELTRDAAKHKAGRNDPELPKYQNPLHYKNPKMMRYFREDFDSEEEFEANVSKLPALQRPDGTTPLPTKLAEIAEECLHLNMLEMNELISRLEEHFGFQESDMEPDSGGGGGADDDDDDSSAASAPVVERTTCDIKLVSYDAQSKIKLIKEVRAMTGLGLKEAKELVDKVPSVIQKDIKMETAKEVKAKLEELGATVELD